MAAPLALYRAPRTPFVARFLGMPNVLPLLDAGPDWVETALGRLAGVAVPAGATALLLRPDALRPTNAPGRRPFWVGLVVRRSFRGRHLLLDVVVDGRSGPLDLQLELPSTVDVGPVRTALRLELDLRAVVALFGDDG